MRLEAVSANIHGTSTRDSVLLGRRSHNWPAGLVLFERKAVVRRGGAVGLFERGVLCYRNKPFMLQIAGMSNNACMTSL